MLLVAWAGVNMPGGGGGASGVGTRALTPDAWFGDPSNVTGLPVPATSVVHSAATLRYFLLDGRARLEPLRVFDSRRVTWRGRLVTFYALGTSHAVVVELGEMALTELLTCHAGTHAATVLEQRAASSDWSVSRTIERLRYDCRLSPFALDSTLEQINGDNFDDLEVTWRFKTTNLGPYPDFNYQTTPLMIDGALYATAGSRRNVVSLDAATGEMRWVYRLDEGERGANAIRRMSGRGVAYWTDGEEDERIFFVTIGYQLVGLDAKTGLPIPGFGHDGIVDLKQDNDQYIDPLTGEIGWNSAPVVARDVVIVGASHRSGGAPPSPENVKGYIRGFDVRTGQRKWIFHTIPRPGEFGRETWLNDSAVYTGNTGVWTNLTVDEELGIAYLPIEIPTGDYYGQWHSL